MSDQEPRSPLSNEVAVQRASALIEMHRAEEALPILRSALASDPEDGMAMCELARAYLSLRRYAESREAAIAASGLLPDNEWPCRVRAYAAMNMSLRREAMDAARMAVQLAPWEPRAFHGLAEVMLHFYHRKGALEASEKLVELAPDWADAHDTRGRVMLMAGKPALAEECFKRALALDPNAGHTHNNLGVALQQRNKHRESIDAFERAAKIDPRQQHAHRNLASAVDKLGQFGAMGLAVAVLAILRAALVASHPEGTPGWMPYATVIALALVVIGPLAWHHRQFRTLPQETQAWYRDLSRRRRRFYVGFFAWGVGLVAGWIFGLLLWLLLAGLILGAALTWLTPVLGVGAIGWTAVMVRVTRRANRWETENRP